MNPYHSWNDERVATLRKLVADGLHYSTIAARLGGVTRNACIGKAARLGIGGRREGPRKTTLHPVARFSKKQTRRFTLERVAHAPHVQSSIAKAGGLMGWLAAKLAQDLVQHPIPPSPLPPAIARLTFAALEDGHCRYPVGDPRHAGFGFCGEPRVPGQSYCSTCCQRVYAPPKVRSISPAVGFKGQARVDVERISAVAQFLAT